MTVFEDFKLSKQLRNAIEHTGFEQPTPIQSKVFSIILSGKDIVGIAQTGTGKTFAYTLPLLQDLPFSNQINPRILVLVPTRELVLQTVEMIKDVAQFVNARVIGVYGGTNINTQWQSVARGMDILVATPGRLYDLVLNGALQLKAVKKLVIDEVDVMLDLGFRHQLKNIFGLLPARRQNIMFSATMTSEIDQLIDEYFVHPKKISIAVSGTPLENIEQSCYAVPNFYTKVNLLAHLLTDKESYSKVLVFVSHKKKADRLFEALENQFESEIAIIHSNKSQNYRIRSIQNFEAGETRILVTTDVMARGLDLENISHVINFDTPDFPENYMHRIGRTGRAKQHGKSVLFFTGQEEESKIAIEIMMNFEIPQIEFPEEVEISKELIEEERPKIGGNSHPNRNLRSTSHKPLVQEKKEKNQKINQGGSYRRKLAKKYKKPQTRGDKNFNRRNKKK